MNFKKFLAATALAFAMPCFVNAQEAEQAPKEEGWIFSEEVKIPITSIKDQNAAGTCWCYSSLAFVEAELLRMNNKEYDFSEMFLVWNTYMDRAQATVRTHGDISFSQGGSFYDVLYGIKHYGLVPDSELPAGVTHGETLSDFSEFSRVCDPFVEGIVKGRKLQTDAEGNPLWRKALAGILDAYIGERPETFVYEGVEYTPMSFAESTGFNPDDYVNLASFSHHPFYEKFVIEVQDNWRWGTAYNLPIDEFMESYEPLVDVINHPKIIYDEKTIERPLLLRKNVLVKIHKVADKLPDGVYLKIYSAYRSRIEVYEKWKAIVDELTKENPQMGRAQILSLAKFKAPNPKSLGGHETGGAIDVALCDANGEELDFGTYYHESSAANKTHSKLITKEQRYNRKMLLKLMKSQNFVNNPYQWWHFSYGDNVWAAYKGKRVGGAIYDAAEKEFENVGYVRIVQTVITSHNPKQ